MLTSRRLARQGANRLASSSSASTTTGSTSSTGNVGQRVFLTKTKQSPAGASNKHSRSYQSSLRQSYLAVEAPFGVAQLQGGAASSSWMKRAFGWYSKKLSTNPLLTKSLTGAIIAAAGDILCQAGTFDPSKHIDNAKHQKTRSTLEKFLDGGWDYRRSFHFFVLGLTFVAPTSHYWYGALAKNTLTKGQSFVQISKRVALDQFVWTPVFFVIWLGGFWSMESSEVNPSKLQQQFKTSLPEVMVANWILWIPAQYLNFYACPLKFQVLFVNIIELGWNAYLSFAASGGGHAHSHSAAVEAEDKSAMTTCETDMTDPNEGTMVAL